MLYLTLDTCTLIYIAQLTDDTLLKSFEKLVKDQKITLIVPEIVEREFQRNKQNTIIEPLKSSYHTKLKHVNEMSKLVSEIDGQTLQDIFQKYTETYEEVLETHNDNIRRIEILLQSGIKCTPSEENKVLAAEWALEQKAPFFGKGKMKCLIA